MGRRDRDTWTWERGRLAHDPAVALACAYLSGGRQRPPNRNDADKPERRGGRKPSLEEQDQDVTVWGQ